MNSEVATACLVTSPGVWTLKLVMSDTEPRKSFNWGNGCVRLVLAYQPRSFECEFALVLEVFTIETIEVVK